MGGHQSERHLARSHSGPRIFRESASNRPAASAGASRSSSRPDPESERLPRRRSRRQGRTRGHSRLGVLSDQPDNAKAHVAKSLVYFGKAQFDAAIAEANAAISDDRNLPDAHAEAGFYQILVGGSADAFQEIEIASRLSPRDPFRCEWDYYICHAHAHLTHWDQASQWCAKSIAANSSWWMPYIDLAAAYGWMGHDTEASAAVARIHRTGFGQHQMGRQSDISAREGTSSTACAKRGCRWND
jgi:tetratricopeptide (TPR) repeat protein